MRKQNEIEDIKKLIQSGFDLKLISFELEIPIEELIQYKIDLETNRANNRAHLKISQMREKYNQLYFRSNKVEVERPKTLSQEDVKLIETVIATIEQKIKEMKAISKKEKKYAASNILSELKKIEEYQLPMVQAEKIYMLMCSQELQNLNTSVVDRIDYYMDNQRRKIANNYAKAIEFEQYDINDIETLKVLERKITGEMVKENPISIESVKRKIASKILDIQHKNAIERIRNDIPTSIILIIQDLVNANIDIQKANEIIDKEVQKRVESKSKTIFSLTEEQERRQILIQIRTAIIEKADKLQIKDPESTILQIQELCGGELGQSIRTVVANFIGRKEFETAKRICDKFSKKSEDEEKESIHTQYMKSIRNEIKNAEISNVVMNAINMNGTPEEESAYFSLIEKGVKMGNINLRAISLGKSADGLKNITLADIWNDENQRYK